MRRFGWNLQHLPPFLTVWQMIWPRSYCNRWQGHPLVPWIKKLRISLEHCLKHWDIIRCCNLSKQLAQYEEYEGPFWSQTREGSSGKNPPEELTSSGDAVLINYIRTGKYFFIETIAEQHQRWIQLFNVFLFIYIIKCNMLVWLCFLLQVGQLWKAVYKTWYEEV